MSGNSDKFQLIAEEIENQEKKMNNIEKGITQIRENMLSIARSDIRDSPQVGTKLGADDVTKKLGEISIESLVVEKEKEEKDILSDPEDLFDRFERELDSFDDGDFFKLIGEVTKVEKSPSNETEK